MAACPGGSIIPLRHVSYYLTAPSQQGLHALIEPANATECSETDGFGGQAMTQASSMAREADAPVVVLELISTVGAEAD